MFCLKKFFLDISPFRLLFHKKILKEVLTHLYVTIFFNSPFLSMSFQCFLFNFLSLNFVAHLCFYFLCLLLFLVNGPFLSSLCRKVILYIHFFTTPNFSEYLIILSIRSSDCLDGQLSFGSAH